MGDTMLTRSSERAVKARHARPDRPRPQVATVTLPVDILRMVHVMQMARNSGRDTLLVSVQDWRIVTDLNHPPTNSA